MEAALTAYFALLDSIVPLCLRRRDQVKPARRHDFAMFGLTRRRTG